jgi:sugar O-acyltransferase (sialic acid O-acetyltransferase NeuD family)
MSKLPIIIVGSSGHAKVVIDIVNKLNCYELIGVIDPFRTIGEKVFSVKILGSEDVLIDLIDKYNNLKVFVAIGDNFVRQTVVERLKLNFKKIDFVSLVHPSVQIGENVQIGKGVVIMSGVSVNSDTLINDFVIINTNASVDHDCFLDDFSSLAPGVVLGGNCKIGFLSAISIGTTIVHRVVIGYNVVVGAGSLILNNCPDNSLVYGSPARFIRSRNPGDNYL